MYAVIPPKLVKECGRSHENEKKLEASVTETEGLAYRHINCPHCGFFLFDAFEDISGHIAIKCNRCKGVVVLNPEYFKRLSGIRRRSAL